MTLPRLMTEKSLSPVPLLLSNEGRTAGPLKAEMVIVVATDVVIPGIANPHTNRKPLCLSLYRGHQSKSTSQKTNRQQLCNHRFHIRNFHDHPPDYTTLNPYSSPPVARNLFKKFVSRSRFNCYKLKTT